jgi:hypothetical protein
MFFHVTPATKRRQEDTINLGPTLNLAITAPAERTVYRENRLIHLCRANQWSAVLQRCQSHPVEAAPHPLREEEALQLNSFKRRNMTSINPVDLDLSGGAPIYHASCSSIHSDHHDDIFHDTALGIACACHQLDTDELRLVVEALVTACPDQVYASQLIPGHTPLRDAIKNQKCSRHVLSILLHANPSSEAKNFSVVPPILIKDRDGLYPIDYLIMGVQLGTPKQSLELLQDFIQAPGLQVSPSNKAVSPLIRLLTLGTSFGVPRHHHHHRNSFINSSPWPRIMDTAVEDVDRLSRVLNCAQLLLRSNPSLISECSRATGCSPLHVALRNYGNYAPLIKLLMEHDCGDDRMIKLRNSYGDLPLHVACSVGVPLEVLHLVLQCTIRADPTHKGNAPHPLAWSINGSGYTPIDLEWVRHIESGKGFYAARSFYPLDAAGVRKHCRKQDGYYKDLLEEAVNQVVTQDLSHRTENTDSDLDDDDHEFLALFREDEAKNTFGMLIDRFQILVEAASFGRMLPLPSKEPSTCKRLLHATAMLSQPIGPSLPLPLLHLSLWLHQEQIEKRDDEQRLPLHYALGGRRSPGAVPPLMGITIIKDNAYNGQDWKLFVQTLIKQAPASSRSPDKRGQLPLHMALEPKHSHGIDVGGGETLTALDKDTIAQGHQNQQQIIETLVESYPDSVDRQDPTSNLFPFMVAATNPNLPLDAVYFLLRRSPSRCRRSHAAH